MVLQLIAAGTPILNKYLKNYDRCEFLKLDFNQNIPENKQGCVDQTNFFHFKQMIKTYQYQEANYNVYFPYFPEIHHIYIHHAH